MPESIIVPSTPEEDRELDRLAELAEGDRNQAIVESAAARERLRELGAMVRSAREDNRVTIDELAESCGIEPEALSRIEAGRTNVTYDMLQRIATALGRELSVQLLESA